MSAAPYLPPYLLYLHGFRSSPRSFKARVVSAALEAAGQGERLICPQLPASPKAAIALCLELAERHAPAHGGGGLAIVGSSLGGFYACWLAERLGVRAAVINPSSDPTRNLEHHVGVTTAWHSDEPFEFRPEYIDELRALRVDRITRPERYFLLAATGDEVLDYRDMVAHYAGARQHVIDGGDHAVSDFPRYVDEVLAFCGLGAGSGAGAAR